MIGKVHIAIVASILSLTALAALTANAAEPSSNLKSLKCSIPDYPSAWYGEDLQGTVRLAVLVGADGSVKDAKVVESSGHRALDKASLRAGATCKAEAALKDGDGVSGWTTVQYKWVMD